MHIDTVEGLRLGGDQALELGAFELDLVLAQQVFFKDARVRIDDDDAARAIDNDLFAVADQRTGVLHADHRRDRQAAGEDGGMRGGAADIGDEGGETVILEGDDIGRRQVVRDDDAAFFLDPLGRLEHRLAGAAEQFLDDALDDLDDVELALAQVGVVKLLELSDQMLHLLHQCPFGIAAPLADDLARLVDQLRVFQEHGVDVDEGGELGRGVLGGFLHGQKFALDQCDGGFEAGNFLVDHARCDGQVRNFQRCVRHQHRPSDGDAA